MSDPQLSFKTKKELLDWFQKEAPQWCSEYLPVKNKIKESGFSGASQLIKREVADESIENFLSVLTEINIANLLLTKSVKNLCYEPKGISGVDFSFDKILISVKNLNTKNYEKVEWEEIEKMKSVGGGKNTLVHKSFSNIEIEVEKTEMGTYSYSRLETGNSGFLASDLDQMSPALKYIGEFEDQANIIGHKKVLFILTYSQEFNHYHAIDIGFWYFNALPKGYQRIFQSDPSWYLKLMKKTKKDNAIDALVFMFPPNPLIWPSTCFTEIIKDKKRVLIFTRDSQLEKELLNIFS